MIRVSNDHDETHDRYRLGGRERRGLLAGWRGGQVAIVAVALVLAVLALRISAGVIGILFALLLVLVGVAAACWPVRGRTIEEWLPALARQAMLAAGGRQRWRSPEPGRGDVGADRPLAEHPRHSATGRQGVQSERSERSVRFCHLELGVANLGRGGGEIGVLRDGAAGTRCAVLAASGTGFALLGAEERGERVASWSRVLASLARDGSGLHRVQWVERCVDESTPPNPVASIDRQSPERASYAELAEATARGYRHELYFVVAIREPRARRGTRSYDAATAQADTRLIEETASFDAALRRAGVAVEGALSSWRLRELIGSACGTATRGHKQGGSRHPWPLSYEVHWEALRTDGAWHATFWIAEWPRSEVGSDFLVPLVTSAVARRTLSVTLAPVAPLRASRSAEHARTSGVADAELRRRHGFAVTARARRDHDSVVQREAELAGGHASYRFSGYLTVTEPDRERLERSCESVERLAASCQLELRRLYGSQDLGFLATLPAGRGLS